MSTFIGIAFVVIQAIMGLVFGILVILSLIQLRRAQTMKKQDGLVSKNNEPNSIIVSLYYGFLLILCLIQSIFQVWFSVLSAKDDSKDLQTDDQLLKLFNNGNYIPDCIFFIIFNLVFAQMILYNEYAHLKYGNMLLNRHTLSVANHINVPKKLQIGLLIYMCAQIVIIILFNQNVIDATILNFIDLCFNASLPVLLVIYFIWGSRKYAGAPTRSVQAEDNISSLKSILIYFAVGRVIQCVQNFALAIQNGVANSIITDSTTQQNELWSWMILILIVVNILVCQIIPFAVSLILSKQFHEDQLLTLDSEVVKMNEVSMIGKEASGLQASVEDGLTDNDEKYDMYRAKLSITDYKNRTIIQINIEEVLLDQPFKNPSVSQVQLGELHLGTVRKGKYENKQFMIRKLQVKRLSQYLIEEMNNNIQEYRALSCKYIQPIKALAFDNENVYFFTPYFEKGNLYSIINSTNEVPLATKKHILLEVAKGMSYLNNQNPSIYHGHLTPNNILITKTGEYRIIDFGLPAMKKYVALLTGYTTKCQYTAPEIIKDRSLTPSFSQYADIYAFGVIAWELIHQKQAFKGLSIQELQVKVGDEKKRPKIADDVDPAMATMIRTCWQDDQQLRPTFDQIIRALTGQEALSLDIPL